jgi:Zn-dependent protease with chaperone function
VNLVVAAGLLAFFSILLLGPLSASLARAQWIERAPRAAVLLWQCMGLSAIVSGIGAGLAVAVSRYRMGLAGGTAQLAKGIVSSHPLQGLGLYDALGLTLATDLGIVLCVVFVVAMVRTVRLRARHRRILDLVTHEAPAYPGTEFLADQRAVAYCLPGLRPRIVISDGTLALLDNEELWAVIHHERGHAHEYHGLVMLPMIGLKNILGWLPYARHASTSMARLLEMAADDFSSRRCGRGPLAAALVEMAATGWAPTCGLAAASTDIAKRVSRLLGRKPTSRALAALAVGLGVGVLLLPMSAAVLT